MHACMLSVGMYPPPRQSARAGVLIWVQACLPASRSLQVGLVHAPSACACSPMYTDVCAHTHVCTSGGGLWGCL